jgi:hypothetical protein
MAKVEAASTAPPARSVIKVGSEGTALSLTPRVGEEHCYITIREKIGLVKNSSEGATPPF